MTGLVSLGPAAAPADHDRAVDSLARFLESFCGRKALELQNQRLFSRSCGRWWNDAGALREQFQAEMTDMQRARRRVLRIQRKPREHARRELRRLVALLQPGPFLSIDISSQGVTACVASVVTTRPAELRTSFEICLPSPDHDLAPVFIAIPGETMDRPVFIQGGAHGTCRGEAESLIEMCAERADLSGLMLTALAWARRNLA